MVVQAAEAGARAERAQALDYLCARPQAFDGVFCSHVVEHLGPEAARLLIEACAQALRARGVLCLVTPNPGSLPTLTHEFWRDPTHARPYDLAALEYLCVAAGLEIVASGANPESQRGLPIEPADLNLAQAEPVAPEVSPEQPRLARGVAAQFAKSRLARELQAVIHGQQLRIERLEARVGLLAGAIRRLLEVLYEPSEIYVVAQKNPGGQGRP